ncbi:MAG: selenium metabolism-associated LysR family transcriptional regulator [Thermodesulfobacteriota bacterium]
MELRYLEIFCKVAEHKSFSRAAEALHLTQPTISIHIKSLEDELGTKLFDRLGRSVVPTGAGDLLYQYASEIVRLKEEARLAMDELSGKMRGCLIVGASTIPGEYLLPAIIGRFKKAYPEVLPTLKVGDTKGIYAMVLEGGVDVGVVGSLKEDKNIVSSEFLADELVLVGPGTFRKGEVSKRELKELPLLLREAGSGTRATLESALSAGGIDPEELNIAAEMGSTQAMRGAVAAGMGFAFISRVAVQGDIERGTLRAVKVKGINIKRRFHIITHRLRTNSPIARTFMEFLSESR